MSVRNDRLALTCPQCGGALPRQASWRMVACPYCQANVTRSASVVERAWFRDAHRRTLADARSPGPTIHVGAQEVQVLRPLGQGEHSEVYLARRCSAPSAKLILKLGQKGERHLSRQAALLERLVEGSHLRGLTWVDALPQLEQRGAIGEPGHARETLLLRHTPGFWGTMEDVLQFNPQGIQDVRHAVWLWRRVLAILAGLHALGWTHGDLHPSHWLIHPADHAVQLLGWSKAREGGDPGLDLQQSAWAIRALLAGHANAAPTLAAGIPRGLSALLKHASEDARWCLREGAAGLDRALMAEAEQAFGTPTFVPFNPTKA
jgi:hypothetical protein